MSLPNTRYGAEYLADYLSSPKKIFFAGVGGISMCSLAWIAHLRGHQVSGYDRTPTSITKQLIQDGIPVFYQEDASHILGIDLLVYTVAMPATNAEYAAAIAAGIPCVSRADFLGYIMSSYTHRIGVCGMHGKSTTTAMLERIFSTAGKDPVVSCGATMKDVGTPYRIGQGDEFIFEACEYMDSFLDFYPTTAVVLNIEMDHVDYFHSMVQIQTSFRAFMEKTGPSGISVVNADNKDVMEASKNYSGRLVTFSTLTPSADYFAGNVSFDHACASFDLFQNGIKLERITMNVPGKHIIADALAAAAASIENGVDPRTVGEALAQFSGAERRLEFCGKTPDGASVYSDYAHHPTEIRATLSTAKEMGFSRIFCVFQPHTYSRTNELLLDFADALSSASIEEILLAEIYPARETNVWGISSERLADLVAQNGQPSQAFPDFNQIINYLLGHAQSGDMILIMGAGDVNTIVKNLLS